MSARLKGATLGVECEPTTRSSRKFQQRWHADSLDSRVESIFLEPRLRCGTTAATCESVFNSASASVVFTVAFITSDGTEGPPQCNCYELLKPHAWVWRLCQCISWMQAVSLQPLHRSSTTAHMRRPPESSAVERKTSEHPVQRTISLVVCGSMCVPMLPGDAPDGTSRVHPSTQ